MAISYRSPGRSEGLVVKLQGMCVGWGGAITWQVGQEIYRHIGWQYTCGVGLQAYR